MQEKVAKWQRSLEVFSGHINCYLELILGVQLLTYVRATASNYHLTLLCYLFGPTKKNMLKKNYLLYSVIYYTNWVLPSNKKKEDNIYFLSRTHVKSFPPAQHYKKSELFLCNPTLFLPNLSRSIKTDIWPALQ